MKYPGNTLWKFNPAASYTEAAKKYYSKYLLFAKPQSPDEKKAYDYLRKKYLKEK